MGQTGADQGSRQISVEATADVMLDTSVRTDSPRRNLISSICVHSRIRLAHESDLFTQMRCSR